MLDDPALDLHADVLKVGHHGSQTSTSFAFTQAVSPTYAIISCGKSSKDYPDVEVGMNLFEVGGGNHIVYKDGGDHCDDNR